MGTAIKLLLIFVLSATGSTLAEECRATAEGLQYTGQTNLTSSGRTCQRWDTNSPHRATCARDMPEDDVSEAENFCRNPNYSNCKKSMPWCYTTDSKTHWEYCYIPECGYTAPADCSSPLGMESGDIKDEQITASSKINANSVGAQARLNNDKAAWLGAWVADWHDINNYYPYVQVDLLTVHRITRLYIQGAGNAVNAYTKTFLIYTSPDGLSWQALMNEESTEPKFLLGNEGRYHTTPHVFDPPLEALKVTVMVKTWYSYPSLRMELFGCALEGLPPYNTPVTSDITKDTVWQLEWSPYVIAEPTTVRFGAKLTIQPGVKVFFTEKDAKLIVEGCLHASGIKGLEVQFLSDHVMAQTNTIRDENLWRGIEFGTGACGTMQHVVVAAAYQGIQVMTEGIKFDSVLIRLCREGIVANFKGSLEVTNSVFEDVNEGIVAWLTDSQFRVSNTRFYSTRASSSTRGVNIKQCQNSRVEVTDCDFNGMQSHSFLVDKHDGSTYQFRRTVFASTQYGISLSGNNIYDHQLIDIEIDSCLFEAVSAYGFYTFDRYQRRVGHINITNTIFRKCNSAASTYSSYRITPSLLFRNVTVEDGNNLAFEITGWASPIVIEDCTFLRNRLHALKISSITFADILIQRNKFVRNGRDGLISIEHYSIPQNYDNLEEERELLTQITTNTFVNNTVTSGSKSVIFYKDDSQKHRSKMECRNNVFNNPGSVYDISSGTAWKHGYVLDATSNDWGSSDPVFITGRVFDFFQNMEKAEIQLNPARNGEDVVDISRSFVFQPLVGIGGRIEEDIEFNYDNMTVSVLNTIHIPPGVKVVITGDATFNFKQFTGIVVQGTLEFGGNGSFTCTSESEWNGIRFINSPESFLRNGVISKTTTGVRIESSSLQMTSVTVDTSKYDGINALLTHQQTLHLINCSLQNSQRTGLNVRASDPTDKTALCSIRVQGGTLTNNRNRGIDVNVVGVYFMLHDMVTDYNWYDDVRVQSESGTIGISDLVCHRRRGSQSCIKVHLGQVYSSTNTIHHVTISNSSLMETLASRTQSLVFTGTYVNSRSTIILKHNRFSCVDTYCLDFNFHSYNTPAPSVEVLGNYFYGAKASGVTMRVFQPNNIVFKENTFDEGIEALYLYPYQNGANDGVKLENNMFRHYKSDRSVIHVLASQFTATALFQKNSFLNNTVSAILHIEGTSSVAVLDNVFENPDSQYDLKTSRRTKEGEVMYAKRNWWGSAKLSDIGQQIFDQSDDPDTVPVDFEPYRTSRDGSSLSSETRSFIRDDGEIGGQISQNIVLEKNNSPYTAVENIVIPPGLSLTIEAGTTIYFQNGGITVQGRLMSDGSENDPVILVPKQIGQRWTGISFQQPFSGLVRLVDGVSDNEGLVEFFFQGHWYSLCDQGYDQAATADVACKELGFVDGAEEFYTKDVSGEEVSDKDDISSGLEQRYAQCYSRPSTLQHCYIGGCQSARQNIRVGIRCIPNDFGQDEVRRVFIASKARSGARIGFDSAFGGVLTDSGNIFRLVTPGLSGERGSISFESSEKPGWFLRHYGSEIRLEPESNPGNPNTFATGATFTPKELEDGKHVVFESHVVYEGLYITVGDEDQLLMTRGDLSDKDFLELASFSYDDLEGAKRRRRSILETGAVASVVQHTQIHSSVYGCLVRGTPPILDGVLLNDTTDHSIAYEGYVPGANFIIRNSVIRESKQNGITLNPTSDSFGFSVEVENTVVSGCALGLQHGGRLDLTVRSCSFSDNKEAMNFLQHHSTVVIEDSVMTGHSSYVVRRAGSGTFDFLRNTIKENVITEVSHAFSIESHNNFGDLSRFVNNTFERNELNYRHRYSNSLLSINWLMYNLQIIGNTFENNLIDKAIIKLDGRSSGPGHVIQRNVFVNNRERPGRDQASAVWVIHGGDSKVRVQENTFSNPAMHFELQVGTYMSQDIVDASRNFWNGTNSKEVLGRIDCFFNNMELTLVNIWPIRLTERLDNAEYKEWDKDEDFFAGYIGGDVQGAVRIIAGDGPYTVDRSILVRVNASIEIESGTTLYFKPKRGIRVFGHLKTLASRNEKITMSRELETKNTWYGISMEKTDQEEEVSLSNFQIEYCTNGLALHHHSYNITDIHLLDAGFGVNFNGQGPLSIWQSTFTGGRQGVYVSAKGAVSIEKCVFKNNAQGLTVPTAPTLHVSECHFEGQTTHGLHVTDRQADTVVITGCSFTAVQRPLYGYLGYGCQLKIMENNFTNADLASSSEALYLATVSPGDFRVENNEFADLKSRAVTVSPQNNANNGYLSILGNNFKRIAKSPLSLNSPGYLEYVVERNVFSNNHVADSPGITSIEFGSSVNMERPVRILLNDFEDNDGESVIYINAALYAWYTRAPTFFLEANTFYNNRVGTTVVQTKEANCEIHYNIFSSPESPFDLKVDFTGTQSVNATMNWWGTKDPEKIGTRIYDQVDDDSLGIVIYEPFMEEPEFSCEGVASCSGQGACVRPDVCRCDDGWKGLDCSEYSCSEVLECSNRGQCVGSNKCECESGWLQPDCVRASCADINDCNNHGVCVGPNICRCAIQFEGDACEKCKSGYWGEFCRPCPRCVNGDCHPESGVCVCDGPNWSGLLCEKCSEKYYGPKCQPLIKVLRVAPKRGPDVGGTTIYVQGHNFPNSDDYRCLFGTEEVDGTFVSDEEIRCISPSHAEGTVTIEIRPTADGSFTTNKVTYTYYAVCPESACGSTKTPPRGSCSMGKCLCINPYLGDDCDILGIAPTLAPIPPQTAVEGGIFQLELETSEGTQPVEYTLVSGPRGMILEVVNSMITWPVAIASPTPYQILIRARNPYGSNEVVVPLEVPISYTASLDELPSGPFQQASQVLISGKVEFLEQNSPLDGTNVPIDIIIHSAIGPRVIRTRARSGINVFYERFYPSSRENGLFEIDARHPADQNFEAQYRWSVYGLTLTTAKSYWSGYLGEHVHIGAIVVKNTGVDVLTNLQLSSVNLPFQLEYGEVNNTKPRCSPQTGVCPLVSVLFPGETAVMDAFVDVKVPVRGGFTVRVFTGEGPTRQMSLSFDYKEKKPKLVLNPTRLTLSLIRGRSYTTQVNVTNRGLRPATNVRAELPDLPILSVISLGMAGSDSDDNLVLQPEETAELSLGLSPLPEEPLGTLNGRIVLRALETAESLSYRLTIVSSDKLDLVVKVEDEFTYFAEDRPLLEGATVQLRSQLGGGSYTLTTDKTGMVTFENIREDYYSLYCSAPKHVGDSRVIFATASDAEISIFLERTAVTYSWVVTPVTYEDEYEITLEADFETFVPMPVVTIKPQELDLEVLQRGLQPVIDFELTNHGLIAAQNVNFRLPARDSHPFLYFEMDIDEIGDLPANTTFYLPVRVVILEDKKQAYLDEYGHTLKKRNPLACLFLSIYAGFSYLCDRERFQQLAVPLRNAINKNCGGGGGGSSGPSGSSHWNGYSEYTVGPNVNRKDIGITKPLTCDEVINCLIAAWYCFNTVVKGVKCVRTPIDVDITVVPGRVKFVLTCYKFYKSVKKCRKYYKKCSSGSSASSRRRRRQALLSQNDLAPELAERLLAATDYYEEAEIILGDENWLETDSASWIELALTPTMADNSPGGSLITDAEYASIWDVPLPTNVTQSMAEKFVKRMNNTIHSWDSGVLEGDGIVSYSALSGIQERIQANKKTAEEAGYTSMSDWYEDGYQTFESAREISEEGVCAKVRIQIKQRLVLTRSAFNARLELENGEEHELTFIGVEIIIVNTVTKELATHMFAIGDPEMQGISNVDGTGTLGIKKEGSADWLIIPYGTAAPEEATKYDIGGNLFYTVGEDSITVPLFPDTVTVQPDPRLYLNYFLEKFVQSDDALTEDIVEPTVPFSLGILVSNAGFGTATNLHITSGQPEIIENEKGLLIQFSIIGAQLGVEPISPSLRINFGDIAPHTTKMARWLMTSSLKGVFSNYSATFENTNPLGDPELSVMESVLFHELLHVVMADASEETDDGIPDFLTIDKGKLDIFPGDLYLSNDGTYPLDVAFGNITRVDAVTSSRFQIVTAKTFSGWNYFRTVFESDITLTPERASRSDGRRINVEYNLWIDSIDDVTHLHFFDYFEDGGSAYSYDVTFLQANDHKPKFDNPDYYANVTENQMTVTRVITVQATDADEQVIKYKLVEGGVPFSIDEDAGSITLTKELDREETQAYTLTILAIDNGTPERTGTAAVQVLVQDVNDNRPVLQVPKETIRIEEIIEPGHVLFKVDASDLDLGLNGEVTVTMESSSDLFELIVPTGSVRVKEALEGFAGSYTITFTATDNGSPPMDSSASTTIEVLPINVHAPEFEQLEYNFEIEENNKVRSPFGQVAATDLDAGDEIRYSLQPLGKPIVGIEVDEKDGELLTTIVYDYEKEQTVTFNVLAVDNGAEPTGQKSGVCSVTVTIKDQNDNSPTVKLPPQPVTIPEDTQPGTFIVAVQATDADSGDNGKIKSFRLSGVGSDVFTLSDEGKINLEKDLDREKEAEYTLTITVEDGGDPTQSTERTLKVKITDVNDNPPKFPEESLDITIQKATSVNSEVVQVEAPDADEGVNSVVVYSIATSSAAALDFFSLNKDTGSVRLIKSLKGATTLFFDFEIKASDGKWEAEMELHIKIAETNIHAPSFLEDNYEVTVSESAAAGTVLDVNLEAEDLDSLQLSYAIIAGNGDNLFNLAAFTGELTLLGSLDYETKSEHTLTVMVSDGGLDGKDVLTGTATVVVNVLNENEASPVFVNGSLISLSVEENKSKVIATLVATDADKDSIEYSLIDLVDTDEPPFSINAQTGALSTGPLDRETQENYLIFVAAVDSGEPQRTSIAEVHITVKDVNDNSPQFEEPEYDVTVLLESLGKDRVFFTALATDADEVGLPITYKVGPGTDAGFTVNKDTGECRIAENIGRGMYKMVVIATDGGGLEGSVKLQVTVLGQVITTESTVETTSKKTGDAYRHCHSVGLLFMTTLLSLFATTIVL